MATTSAPTGAAARHLDLGCGAFPRNPYGRAELHGVDLCDFGCAPHVQFRAANITVAQRWRRLRRRLKGQLSHVLWELQAVKPGQPAP